jgi:photosystem II stability/assembly factor-like uncharacterized protein
VTLAGFAAAGAVSLPALPFFPRADDTAEGDRAAEPVSISLVSAWELAQSAATEWQADSQLIALASSDAEGDTAAAGRDGTRRAWVAQFVSARAAAGLTIRILDGRVVGSFRDDSLLGAKPLDKPASDSTDVVRAAIGADPQLAGGGIRSIGLHFAAISDPVSGRTVVRVVGSREGFSAFVDVDPKDGTALGTRSQDYGSDGAVLYSEDGGRTWRASTLAGVPVTDAAGSPDGLLYATVASKEGIPVHVSADAGATWREFGRLPQAAGTWAHDIAFFGPSKTVLVGTPEGLWASGTGDDWQRVDGLPAGAAWSIATTQSEVFVSVVRSPADAFLHSSPDLVHWVTREAGAFRLERTPDGRGVIAVDETSSTASLFGDPAGQGRATIPLPSERTSNPGAPAAGILRMGGDPRGALIAEGPAGLFVSQDGGERWKQTLDASLAGFGVSPAFATDGVVLAGGFRAGIYRSADGGRSWALVLDDPCAITRCSGTVSTILLLDASHAVAVIPPTLAWR